jgi:gliding motility-associated-like protein
LKLKYNTDKLLCEGYININPMLAGTLTGWIDQVAGEITIQWQHPVPVTFTGLETVLELVFTPKEPGMGQLDWYTGATESYFTDLSGVPIPAEFYTAPLTIYDPPEILISGSKTVCEGDSVTIISIASSIYPPLSYLWTYPDGQTQTADPFFASVTQADAGDYTLLVTDSLGCTDQKSIHLVVSEIPVAAFHDSDTLAVPVGYILEAGSGMASYQWNTGDITESIRIDTTGWYIVEMVTHVGCIGADSVYVIITEFPPECLFVPNAFTPNYDGLNDIFKAVSICPLTFFRMEIFNRWGEMLFSSEDINDGWDGKKNGASCPGDAYVYKIVFQSGETMVAEKMKVLTGVVVIVK